MPVHAILHLFGSCKLGIDRYVYQQKSVSKPTHEVVITTSDE